MGVPGEKGVKEVIAQKNPNLLKNVNLYILKPQWTPKLDKR